MRNLEIVIRGPAGSGKTTTAQLLEHMFATHFDTDSSPVRIHEDDGINFMRKRGLDPFVQAIPVSGFSYTIKTETSSLLRAGRPAPGYHVTDIPRGTLGESTKIVEEASEFADAVAQDCKVMALVELSDLIGAIKGYLAKHHPDITIDDLNTMAKITERAFVNGTRS